MYHGRTRFSRTPISHKFSHFDPPVLVNFFMRGCMCVFCRTHLSVMSEMKEGNSEWVLNLRPQDKQTYLIVFVVCLL